MLSLQEQAVLFTQEYNRQRREYGARRKAIRQFWRVYSGALWRRLWAALSGRADHLRDLDADLGRVAVRARHYAGLQTVPAADIRGSEGRALDFDADFRPRHARDENRWTDIAALLLDDERGGPLPPVDLIRLGTIYYVRDGHHRVSAARALGQAEIDALVTVWVTEP